MAREEVKKLVDHLFSLLGPLFSFLFPLSLFDLHERFAGVHLCLLDAREVVAELGEDRPVHGLQVGVELSLHLQHHGASRKGKGKPQVFAG